MTNQVHSITDAPLRHSAEQHGRMVRYTVAMSIRVVCFILAAVVGVVWHSWWAAVFVLAAAVLPYIAVVDANAGGDRYQARRETEGMEKQPRLLTTGGENEQDWVPSPDTHDSSVIAGELMTDDDAPSQESHR